MTVDDGRDLVVSTTYYGKTVAQSLAHRPAVIAALRAASAHVVVFDVPSFGPPPVFERAQQMLDRAEAALPAEVRRPIYLAWGPLSELYPTRRFGTPPRGPIPVAPKRGGVFGGFIARGEGGVAFLGSDGSLGGNAPDDETALRWIAAVCAG